MVTATGSYGATAPLTDGSWIMQMVAFRAASAGPPDTQVPTAPTNLAANAVSSTQINLSWTASTDNVAVTGYQIERCQGAGCSNFALLTTVTTTTYNNTGLAASTSYSYRVRAGDAAGNLSAYSGVASATTLTAPDTTAPSAPTNLAAGGITTNAINLTWTASTDNVGVSGYLVERCQGASCSNYAQIGTASGTSYPDSGLTASTTYRYRVRATDAAGNLSAYSTVVNATTLAVPDTTPPSITISTPTSAANYSTSSTPLSIGGSAADNVGVTQVSWSNDRGGSGTATGTTGWSVSGIALQSGDNVLTVTAQDAAGNPGTDILTVTYTPPPPDTTAPTVPGSLGATAASASQINLSWTASTDNVGVTGYQIERCHGCWLLELCTAHDRHDHQLQQHRTRGVHELQLPRAGHGCGGKSQRLLEHCYRHHALGHTCSDHVQANELCHAADAADDGERELQCGAECGESERCSGGVV